MTSDSASAAGNIQPEAAALRLTEPERKPRIGEKEIAKAQEILTRYQQGKRSLERRIVEDELWWELRHWEVLRRKNRDHFTAPYPQPTSAWLFNAILNKHADAMDNYPEPVVLPRERSDEASAEMLSSVLPVVMEYNDFERTYSDNWWEKLKHGTAAYGVFWNSRKDNGLGDIDIRRLDLLRLFWEPGVEDLQQSRNLFIVDLADTEQLKRQYPDHKGKFGAGTIDVTQYMFDDAVDVSDKTVVVDWYYKALSPAGETVLHFCKFAGGSVLYASENDPRYRDRGWYDHGKYPVVLDVMFPEKGTPVGFGYVAICKDPQMYIDKLSANILENSMMTTKKRFFVSSSTGVNEQEFLDWNKPLVHVEGPLDDTRIREITTRSMSPVYLSVMQNKIEEMKDTAGNRDVNSGSTASGVTAAAAIAALQEAGNKSSRDMIAASYRAYIDLVELCIELMRQFYDEARSFRITGKLPGSYEFRDISNAYLRAQLIGSSADGAPLYRRPVFDLKVKAQKKNPFSRAEQNERARQLYSLGFFNPEKAQEALLALEMMDFEGKEDVVMQIREGQTLLDLVQRLSQLVDQLTGQATSSVTAASGGDSFPSRGSQGEPPGVSGGLEAAQAAALEPASGYIQRLAARSTPDMALGSNAAMPGG